MSVYLILHLCIYVLLFDYLSYFKIFYITAVMPGVVRGILETLDKKHFEF